MTNMHSIIQRQASQAFYAYGHFVGRHPLPFLLAPLLVTVGLSYGLLHLRASANPLALYTASGSRSLKEKAAYLEFIKTTSTPYNFDLVVRRRDGASMLNDEDVDYVLDLYAYATNRLDFRSGQSNFTFADICQIYNCSTFDESLRQFWEIFSYEKSKNGTKSDTIRLSYPVAEILSEKFNLMWLMSNVKFDENRTVVSAGALHLFLFVQIPANQSDSAAGKLDVDDVLKSYGSRFEAYFSELHSDQYEFFVTYTEAVSVGINALQALTLKHIPISIALLVIFTVSSSVTSSAVRSKHFEALAGVANPCLALASAFGFLTLTANYGWNGVVATVPFLTLAIGVDDMFMILSSWHLTNGRTVEERMGQLMAEAGLSVTITSLINVISFVVGVTQGIPAIEAFSAFAAMALAFEYVYQMTFFAAVMVYGGRRETAGRSSCCCCESAKNTEFFGFVPKIDISGFGIKTNWQERFFGNILARLLNQSISKIFVLLLFVAYLLASLWGCSSVRCHFSVRKIVLKNSPPFRYYEFAENIGAKDSLVAYFVVSRPPDFNNASETQSFEQLLNELETIPKYSIGRGASEVWWQTMLAMQRDQKIEEDDFYAYFLDWIDTQPGRRHRFDINFQPANQHQVITRDLSLARSRNHAEIRSFAFRVYYENVSPANYDDPIALMQAWRRLCDQYSAFNVSVWNLWNEYVEQNLIMLDNVMQDTAIAILAIAAVSSVLMPNGICIFWVMYFLLVIEAGVIAFMKIFFDSDLDATTVATLAMCVGFSVDFLLHIACRFYHEQAESYQLRLRKSLIAIGWPIVQATISTLLGVCALLFVPAQLVLGFAQTVTLVVLVGLVQGLLTLPMFLSALDEREGRL